jgi:hypothetical protein
MPLPALDGIAIEYQPIGASRRMLSGYLRFDLMAVKAKATVRWDGLTAAERLALKTQWDLGTEVTVALPDGLTFSAVAITEGWSEEQKFAANNAPYYIVTIVFEEV